jgi:hypothetical protein
MISKAARDGGKGNGNDLLKVSRAVLVIEMWDLPLPETFLTLQAQRKRTKIELGSGWPAAVM